MVIALMAACLLLADPPDDATDAAPIGDASTPARAALERGHYPWYDPKSDSVTPIWPPDSDLDEKADSARSDWRWGAGLARLGDWLAIGLAAVALAVFLAALGVLWWHHRPEFEREAGAATRAVASARIEDLPAGVRPETGDPWAEAEALRRRGDLAGAIVCLFAHQLLSLNRLRLIRLVPGRTGRQYVRAVPDRQVRAWVEPTLRLFEAVYYGHRSPDVEAFERAWELAEQFERHAAAGAAR